MGGELSNAVVNCAGWVFYLIPVFFPNLVWLGLAPILFGFPGQFMVHGVLTNRKLKTLYNPGFGAVTLGHLPLAVWYLVTVYSQGLIHWWDWLAGVGLLAFFAGFVMNVVGLGIVAPRGAEKYRFTPAEYNRWDRERRLLRIGVTPGLIGATSTH